MENKKPIDWENPFCAEDFENLEDYGGPDSETIAEQANARFREILKEHGKKVYTNTEVHGLSDIWFIKMSHHDATKEAWLIGEKEISDK